MLRRRRIGGSHRLAVALLAASVFAIAVCTCATAFAGTPNVCRIIGANRALAVKLFGKGATAGAASTAATTPPNVGTYCQVGTGSATMGALDVDLYAASAFPTIVGGVAGEGHTTKLRRLGPGAVYVVSSDHSTDQLDFKVGRYTVLIDASLAGGQRKSAYPKENQFIEFARAIYAHVR